MLDPCACGCGEHVRPGRRFLLNHQFRVREVRERAADSLRSRHGTVERNAEIVRRSDAGERMADIAQDFGISRQRVEQIVRADRHRARRVAHQTVTKRKPCQRCGATADVQRHHPDYDRPRFVVWLCRMCHADTHVLLARAEAAAIVGVPASDVRSLTEASKIARVPLRAAIGAIAAGEVASCSINRNVFVSVSHLKSWLPRYRDHVRRARIARRKKVCKNGHPLEPWNMRGDTCLACMAEKISRRKGGRRTNTARQYEIRKAFVDCGYTITGNCAGSVYASRDGFEVLARRGHGNPWRITDASGRNEIGIAHTAADLVSMLIPTMREAA